MNDYFNFFLNFNIIKYHKLMSDSKATKIILVGTALALGGKT